MRLPRSLWGLTVPKNRTHICTFESGYRDTYPHITVATIVSNALGQIALVHRVLTEPIEGGKYVLPGGFVESFQTPHDAAEREALEETGYRIVPGTLQWFAMLSGPTSLPGRQNEDEGNVVMVYTAAAGERVQAHDAAEITDVLWTQPASLPSRESMGFGHYDLVGMYQRHQYQPFQNLPIVPASMSREELFLPDWQ